MILLLALFHLIVRQSVCVTYPLCANVTFSNGVVDIATTLYNCIANIPDSMMVPRFVSLFRFPNSNFNVCIVLAVEILVQHLFLKLKIRLESII